MSASRDRRKDLGAVLSSVAAARQHSSIRMIQFNQNSLESNFSHISLTLIDSDIIRRQSELTAEPSKSYRQPFWQKIISELRVDSGVHHVPYLQCLLRRNSMLKCWMLISRYINFPTIDNSKSQQGCKYSWCVQIFPELQPLKNSSLLPTNKCIFLWKGWKDVCTLINWFVSIIW